MKKGGLFFFAILFFLAVFFLPFEGQLLAAPYYQGKTIVLLVGTNPGGGYDNAARIVAKYLPKYIPGKPTVIVQNMPGAGHVIAANYIYNIAKPDGLTIGTYNRGLPFAQLTKVKGVKFNLKKYAWIGSMAVEPTVFFVRADLPFRTAEDLKKAKEPIIVASEGLGTTGYQFPVLLKAFTGINLKIINYLTGADSRLALERKEADARAGSYSSEKPMMNRGLIRPIIRGKVSEPEIKNLPINEDLTTDKKGKTIMAMLASVDKIGRPYMCPPGTPANVMKILRDAFAKVADDPAVREQGKKINMTIDYSDPDECMKILNFVLDQPEDIVKEFSKYVSF
jgi:tripartite-type tricarboxylate transporter receptor subunit TctC